MSTNAKLPLDMLYQWENNHKDRLYTTQPMGDGTVDIHLGPRGGRSPAHGGLPEVSGPAGEEPDRDYLQELRPLDHD